MFDTEQKIENITKEDLLLISETRKSLVKHNEEIIASLVESQQNACKEEELIAQLATNEKLLEKLDRIECESYREKKERGRYLQTSIKLLQRKIKPKIKSYIAIERKIRIEDIDPSKEWFPRGFCRGISASHAAMDNIGKLIWWKAAISKFIDWDQKEDSLRERIRLPQEDKYIRWYSLQILAEPPSDRTIKDNIIQLWKKNGEWFIRSNHNSGTTKIKNKLSIFVLELATHHTQPKNGIYDIDKDGLDKIHEDLINDTLYKKHATINKGILFRRIVNYIFYYQAAFSKETDPYIGISKKRTRQDTILRKHFSGNNKEAKRYAKTGKDFTAYDLGIFLRNCILFDCFENNMNLSENSVHSCTLRYIDGTFYFKDPNYRYGEKKFDDVFELAHEIIDRLKGKLVFRFLSTKNSHIIPNKKITPYAIYQLVQDKHLVSLIAKYDSKQFFLLCKTAINNRLAKTQLYNLLKTREPIFRGGMAFHILWKFSKIDSELKKHFINKLKTLFLESSTTISSIIHAAKRNEDLLNYLSEIIDCSFINNITLEQVTPWKQLCELAKNGAQLRAAIAPLLSTAFKEKYENLKISLESNSNATRSITEFKLLLSLINIYAKTTGINHIDFAKNLDVDLIRKEKQNLLDEYLYVTYYCLTSNSDIQYDKFLKHWSKSHNLEDELTRIELHNSKLKETNRLCEQYKQRLPIKTKDTRAKHDWIDHIKFIADDHGIPNTIKTVKIRQNLARTSKQQLTDIKTHRSTRTVRIASDIYKNMFGFYYGYHKAFKERPTNSEQVYNKLFSLHINTN